MLGYLPVTLYEVGARAGGGGLADDAVEPAAHARKERLVEPAEPKAACFIVKSRISDLFAAKESHLYGKR